MASFEWALYRRRKKGFTKTEQAGTRPTLLDGKDESLQEALPTPPPLTGELEAAILAQLLSGISRRTAGLSSRGSPTPDTPSSPQTPYHGSDHSDMETSLHAAPWSSCRLPCTASHSSRHGSSTPLTWVHSLEIEVDSQPCCTLCAIQTLDIQAWNAAATSFTHTSSLLNCYLCPHSLDQLRQTFPVACVSRKCFNTEMRSFKVCVEACPARPVIVDTVPQRLGTFGDARCVGSNPPAALQPSLRTLSSELSRSGS